MHVCVSVVLSMLLCTCVLCVLLVCDNSVSYEECVFADDPVFLPLLVHFIYLDFIYM